MTDVKEPELSPQPNSRATVRHTWSESDRFVPRAFVQPFQRFMHAETSGAIVMLIAAIAALAWANSPWHEAQATLWNTELDISLGDLIHLQLPLVAWVNDALMTIFFFLVGLEIKRELVHGELRDPKAAALPAIAAVGGMVVPAGLYLALNAGGPGADGWGIPMATDIAFAVAVVALAGPKVPAPAKVFLLTLAIADDIGAILVIAIFYTSDLSFGWLGVAFVTLAVMHAAKRLDVRAISIYLVLGAFVWLAVHESGVHATLAGVVLGLMTPAWSFYDPRRFAGIARQLVDEADPMRDDGEFTEEEYQLNQAKLEDLDRLTNETLSPLERLENKLHLPVAFLIVPLFAFANAGVRLTSDALDGLLTDKIVLGIVAGLVVGKTVGVTLFTLIGARLNIGRLPPGVNFRHVVGVAVTAGIGFTVALFVSALAFGGGHGHGGDDAHGDEVAAVDDHGDDAHGDDEARADDKAHDDEVDAQQLADSSKIGILVGSLIAGVLGYAILSSGKEPEEDQGPASSDDHGVLV